MIDLIPIFGARQCWRSILAFVGLVFACWFNDAGVAQVALPDEPLAQFQNVLQIAQDAGTQVDGIAWGCAGAHTGLLGEVRASRLCLREDLRSSVLSNEDGVILVALALARVKAIEDDRRPSKQTVGGILVGTIAATIVSHVRSQDASNPNPLRYPERGLTSVDNIPDSRGGISWQARGMFWVQRVGVCRVRALDFLSRLSLDPGRDPAIRYEAKTILRSLSQVAYPPEPCAIRRKTAP